MARRRDDAAVLMRSLTSCPPDAVEAAPIHRPRGAWRRSWPLPASILLHAAVLGGYLLTWPASAPPPPPPQIELLPPAPIPPMPEEAAPSPAEAPPKPLPVFPKLAPLPLPQRPLQPLVTTSEKAERVIPKPPKKPPPPDKPAADALATPRPEETRDTAIDAAAAPVSGAKSAANALLGEPSPSARPAGPPPDYIGLVRAQLEKVKRYPAAARAAGIEGTVLLAFTLERSGQVSNWRISHGSGSESLDDEAAAMIHQAVFPPFPAVVDQERLQLIVPLEFSLTTP